MINSFFPPFPDYIYILLEKQISFKKKFLVEFHFKFLAEIWKFGCGGLFVVLFLHQSFSYICKLTVE